MFLKAQLYLFEIFILRVTYRLAGTFLHTLLVKSAGCLITIAIAKLHIGYIYSILEILHNFSTYEAREKLRVRGTHRMSFAVAYIRVHGLDRKMGGGLEREEGSSPFSLSLFSCPPSPLAPATPRHVVSPVALSQFFSLFLR